MRIKEVIFKPEDRLNEVKEADKIDKLLRTTKVEKQALREMCERALLSATEFNIQHGVDIRAILAAAVILREKGMSLNEIEWILETLVYAGWKQAGY